MFFTLLISKIVKKMTKWVSRLRAIASRRRDCCVFVKALSGYIVEFSIMLSMRRRLTSGAVFVGRWLDEDAFGVRWRRGRGRGKWKSLPVYFWGYLKHI